MKKYGLLFLAFFIAAFASAQEEEKIVLPEITTTVSGDSLVAGKEAVPDFSEIVPPAKDASPLPKLPGVQTGTYEDEPIADFSVLSEKTLYAQGLIGAGIPGYFTGDFSIYKTSGSEPFSLKFSHESLEGYGKHDAAEGYFDSNTRLEGKKTFAWKNAELKLSALYDSLKYGLQDKSKSFYDLTGRTASFGTEVKWKLPNDFYAGTSLGAEWYSRNAGIPKSSSKDWTFSQEQETDVTFFNPSVFAGWKNDSVDINLMLTYENEVLWGGDKLSSAGLSYNSDADVFSVNKFDAELSFAWTYSFFKLGISGGVVAGNNIGDNSTLPQFKLSTEFNFEAGEEKLPVSIKVSGGVDSHLEKLSDFEKNFLFTSQVFLPWETTDLFAKAELSIPIGSRIVLDADTTFRKTVFDNGVWEADYLAPAVTSLYGAEQIERSVLCSNAKLSFAWKIFTVNISWKNNLLHVASNEYSNYLGGALSFQSSDASWGFNAGVYEAVGDDVDLCPVLNAEIFYRLKDSIRLACEMEDAIKLISRSDRDYGESLYIKKSGSAKILVRFFF